MTSTVAALLFVLFSLHVPGPEQPAACPTWQACRDQALGAAGREDFDSFHDLAWLAVNLGPKNDPALMTMLARAQSLSGRPGDALVMLQRLAAAGVATDAATSEDFAAVRALPGWSALAPALPAAPAGATSTETTPPAAASPKPSLPSTPDAKRPESKRPEPKRTDKPVVPVPDTPAATGKPSAASVAEPISTEAESKPPPPSVTPGATPDPARPRDPNAPLAFVSSGLSPVGLAYDAVSARFIIGDRAGSRLAVIGERSSHLASMAGISAGFGDITAFAIDQREGDLWVTSVSDGSSTLHKLQLISGRVLFSIAPGETAGLSRFADLALAPASGPMVLDADGRRIFRTAKKGRELELAARLAVPGVTSIAPSSDTIVYAAYDEGLLRVDLTTRSITVVDPGTHQVAGLAWIRWHRGGLVGVQRSGDTRARLVRLRLSEAGTTVRALDTIADDVALVDPSAVTIGGTTLFYLVRTTGDAVEVRKAVIR